ncbi:PspC domain-containing protein [Aeromicrobium sp. A1-2]|uniref:PspC domain-containing protein n=1 Tax=Aeromicrobium sp. A1-2 TaxID=2107713 RepID=UPI000E4A35C0|nr:PspC domain-containing protein [Aeromicrobium sp. A1-2]AXT84067.1 PspC domain-containing protein [Aeromicrobium sp. A1-2]
MKKLTRSRDEKWIGGVCGGIAAYTDLDVNLIRLLLVIVTVLGAGSLIVAYVVAWILMPRAPKQWQPWTTPSTDAPATSHEPGPPSA